MLREVLIIGGGVIGMAIARELGSQGMSGITLVDRGELGGEASWAAAGMLAPNIEAGASGTFHRLCTESLELYPGFANDLLAETGVDIELDRAGTLCVAFDEQELEKLQEHIGRGAQPVSDDEIGRLEPWVSEQVRGGMLFPNDWQVDNRKLMAALRRSIESTGVEILEHTEVSQLIVDNHRVIGASGPGIELYAASTVLATGAWTTLIKTGDAPMSFSVKPIRGQMASFDTGDRKIDRVIFSARGYLVPRADGRVLIGATVEDVGYSKVTTDADIESLRRAAIEIAPQLADVPVAERWSGLRPFVKDGLPVMGGLGGLENVIVATAHYRNGILLAPITARMIAEKLISGFDSEYFVPFGADRFDSPAMNASSRI